MGKNSRGRASLPAPTTWPGWARGLVTAGLIYHMAAVASGALGVPPSSLLERRIADLFTPYHDLVDQGYAYRYYAEPPPTPVITATLRFGDGRPAEVVRLPARSLSGPRMRHQRQLALANALFADFQDAKQRTGDGSRSRLAGAYARHLCSTHAGCTEVTLHAQQHLIPDPGHVREALEAPGAARFDLFDEALHQPGMAWRLHVRRLVIGFQTYLRQLAAATRQGWNSFFFTPADPTAAGLIRIVVGLLAFWSLLVLGLDLHDYFGTHGWASPQ